MALCHMISISTNLVSKISPQTLKLPGCLQSFSTLQGLTNRKYVQRSCILSTCHLDIQRDHLLQPSVSHTQHLNCAGVHTSVWHFAGHSKWANIKHVKGAQDKTKGQKASLLSKQIQVVLTRNPETNPKLNFDLANLIKTARSNNIPNDVIDRAVERVKKLRDPNSLTVFDGRGISNTAILIQCFSVNPKHTQQILQGLVKKFGFNLNSSALDLFDQKGIIEVDLPEAELDSAQSDPENFPLDKYIDIAIETGAEEVTLETDGEKPYLQFTCGHQDLEKVQMSLDAEGHSVSSAERTYIPNLVVPVSKEFIESVGKLTEKLDGNMDVVKYHFNIELEESS